VSVANIFTDMPGCVTVSVANIFTDMRGCVIVSVANIFTDMPGCVIVSVANIPYILESNAHPNLIRTQFLATS
jgi:hypothetical protein